MKKEIEPQHTPTPWVCISGMIWKLGHDNIKDTPVPIAKMDRETQYTKPAERDANAHFIVQAVNYHEEILKTLRQLVELSTCVAYEETLGKSRLIWHVKKLIATIKDEE